MTARKRQSFLHGAVILTAATLVVKGIGAVFKIPLTNLIGGVGMGDFSIAYDIFRPLNALAIAGLPVAVAKLVSENVTLGRFRDARRLLRLSTALFLCTGLVGSGVMLLGSRLFAGLLTQPDSYLAIAALAPALFFCCMMSSWRGYYQGLNNMYPTAVSQMVEAVVKLLAGITLCCVFMEAARRNLAVTGGWVRALYPNAKSEVLISQFGAVGAVLGVTLSTLAGTLFLWVRHMSGDGITRAELTASPAPLPHRTLLRRMVLIAVPVCLGSLAVHLTTLIDLCSIMNRLEYCLRTEPRTVLNMYRGLIPDGLAPEDIAKYLYGSYSSIAVNIFNLVPSLTTTLGVSILPAVAGAWAARNRHAVQSNVESVLRVTALLAIPAGFGFIALSEPITQLLYGARPMEAAIAAGLLRALGVPVIFVSLTTPINAVLQAVGRASVPVRLMVCGGAVKLAINFVLMGIPGVNIQGAPVGTAVCYVFIVVCSLREISKATGVRLGYGGMFLKPAFAGMLCGVAAHTSYALLARVFEGKWVTLAAVAAGGFFYLSGILLTRAVNREDVRMLPGGEKIAKILEKHSMIG